jgi:hypothetical protein
MSCAVSSLLVTLPQSTARSDGGGALMDDREDFTLSKHPLADALVERVARQQSTLIEFLRSIEDNAQLVDASLKEVHELTASLCRAVRRDFFGSGGPLDPSAYPSSYGAFEHTRLDENDLYEVYAHDLERHQSRQRMNLGVAESDADKFAVVKRRREYIRALMAVQAQVSNILNFLRTRPALMSELAEHQRTQS